MGGPLVSVVITHYEQEGFLREALDSVQSQTYGNLEVIIVDDCSTSPRTVSALDSIQSRNVIVVRHARNLGAGAARNSGVASAAGELVVFLDADDLLAPNFVETAVGTLQESAGAELFYTSVETFGDCSGREHFEITIIGLLAGESTPRTFVCTKELHNRLGGYKGHLRCAENSDYWLRVLLCGYSPLYTTRSCYRRRIASTTRTAQESYVQSLMVELVHEHEPLFREYLEPVLVRQKSEQLRNAAAARAVWRAIAVLREDLNKQYHELSQRHDNKYGEPAAANPAGLARFLPFFGVKRQQRGSDRPAAKSGQGRQDGS
jgi:glycosyltransferase involved in cell wall biosynthesis